MTTSTPVRFSRAIAVMCAAVVVSLSAQSRDAAAPQRAVGTATLAGRVMHGNRPLARAGITISPSGSIFEYQTVTSDDGRFTIERLPAGRYLVTASKMGWVTSYYGSSRPGYPPGVRVAVENGARADILIPMVFGSVIGGHIIHEDGRPAARHWPWLLESRMVGDRRMLARARMEYDIGNFERSTDDRGEFRLFGLPPGTYYLLVNPSISPGARLTTSDEVRWALQPPSAAPAPPPGRVAGYATMYFPGTPDPGQAQPIVVGPGEAREGLMFKIGFVPVARVTGQARRPDGSHAAMATVTLRHRELKASIEGSDRSARTDAQGNFTFQNVPPGDYRLTMRASSTTPAKVMDLWGQTDVVVSGDLIEGVGLSLAPASSIAGRLAFDGSTKPPADLTTVRLQFIAAEAEALARSGAGSGTPPHTAVVHADGTFRVEGLPPDRYLVGASWPGMRSGDGSTGWWLSTIRVGGRELRDAPIDVAANENVTDVALMFRDRIGTVEGRLMDGAGSPVPDYYVFAFPADRASWTTLSRRRVPPARPGTDGRFRLNGLLPGEYYLAVVAVMDEDDATDPQFLDAVLPSAIKITVGDGELKRQDLKIGK